MRNDDEEFDVVDVIWKGGSIDSYLLSSNHPESILLSLEEKRVVIQNFHQLRLSKGDFNQQSIVIFGCNRLLARRDVPFHLLQEPLIEWFQHFLRSNVMMDWPLRINLCVPLSVSLPIPTMLAKIADEIGFHHTAIVPRSSAELLSVALLDSLDGRQLILNHDELVKVYILEFGEDSITVTLVNYDAILNDEEVSVTTEESVDTNPSPLAVDSEDTYQLVQSAAKAPPKDLFAVSRRIQIRLETSASDAMFGLRDLDERLLQDWLAALFHVSHFTGKKVISDKINCAEGLRLWLKLSEHIRSHCQLALYMFRLSLDPHAHRQKEELASEATSKGWKDMDDLYAQLIDAVDLDQKVSLLDHYLIEVCDDILHVLTSWVTKQSAKLLKQFLLQYGREEIVIHATALDGKTTATFSIKPGFESDRDDARTEIGSVAGTLLCQQYERLSLRKKVDELMRNFVAKLPPTKQKRRNDNGSGSHVQNREHGYLLWQEVNCHLSEHVIKDAFAESLTNALESAHTQIEQLQHAGRNAEVQRALLEEGDDDIEDDDNDDVMNDEEGNKKPIIRGSNDTAEEYVDGDLQRATDDEHLVPATVITLPSHSLRQGFNMLRKYDDLIRITENIHRSSRTGNIGLLLVHVDEHDSVDNLMRIMMRRSDEIVWLGTNAARDHLNQRAVLPRLKPHNRYLLHFDLTDGAVESTNNGILTVSTCHVAPLELSAVLERLDNSPDAVDHNSTPQLFIKQPAEYVVVVEPLTAHRLEQHDEDRHMMIHEITTTDNGYLGQSRYDGTDNVMRSSFYSYNQEISNAVVDGDHKLPGNVSSPSFKCWKLLVIHSATSFLQDDGNSEDHADLSLLQAIPLHQVSSSIRAHHHPAPTDNDLNLSFYSYFELSFLECGLHNITSKEPLTLVEIAAELKEEKEWNVVEETVDWLEQQWSLFGNCVITAFICFLILSLSMLFSIYYSNVGSGKASPPVPAVFTPLPNLTDAMPVDLTFLPSSAAVTPDQSALAKVDEYQIKAEVSGDVTMLQPLEPFVAEEAYQPSSPYTSVMEYLFTSSPSTNLQANDEEDRLPELLPLDSNDQVEDVIGHEPEKPQVVADMSSQSIAVQDVLVMSTIAAVESERGAVKNALRMVAIGVTVVTGAIASAITNLATGILHIFGIRKGLDKVQV
jgi:hypothetical protein